MLKIARLNHARFLTANMERQIEYYTDVLGLVLAAREAGRAFLATPSGYVSVILEASDTAACTSIGLEIGPDVSIADIEKRLIKFGLTPARRHDVGPGIGETLVFQDPKGTDIEIVQKVERCPIESTGGGICPIKLGHLAFKTPEIQKVVQFYKEVLGFKVGDWRGDFFVFMRCGPDHHTVNFIASQSPSMHHIAFELENGNAMLKACDHLGLTNHPVIWGPGRHLIGGNMFTYHRNPENQIMELYTDLAQMKDEALGIYEPRPWHWDAVYRPKDWPADAPSNLWGVPSPPGFRD